MRVLVAGLGSIGQRHVRNLRALRGARVEILAYRVRRRSLELTDGLEVVDGGDVERTYGVDVFDDLADALATQPDITFVCNPTAMHLPVAMAAACAGSHLFIEKPLSDRWNGIEDLAREVERRRLIAVMGFQMRFHPCLRRLGELLGAGAIGDIVAVRIQAGEYLPHWHPYEDYRESYAARRDLGGGVVLTLIHELDAVLALVGLPRRVWAIGGRSGRLEIDVEDSASMLFECVKKDRTIPVHVQLDFLQRPPCRNYEVIGDRGKVTVDFVGSELMWFDGDGRLAEVFIPENRARNVLFLEELKHVLACVEGTEQPLVDLRDGARSLRMALAALESIASTQVVSLDVIA
jgi:predicted dehydrogenase